MLMVKATVKVKGMAMETVIAVQPELDEVVYVVVVMAMVLLMMVALYHYLVAMMMILLSLDAIFVHRW